MNPGRSGSDKEIQAMTCNQKEDRTLLKRLTTIDMEEHYSMKLLDVKHRQIKTKQNRLRSRVNKITSKLPANQIAEFRTQEEQGRFRQEYNPIAASGAQRIAAASKRLKLQSERDRVKSGRCSFSERKSLQKAREAEFQPVTPRRPMSARVCIATAAEADTSKDVPRCDTARDAIPKEIHEEGAWATKVRRIPDVRHASCKAKKAKPISQPSLRPKTAPTPRFSSHNPQEFDRTRRSSIVSIESGSFDSSKDRKEELRKEMLELEQMNNIRLQTRSKGFIDSTVRWIKANPTSVVSRDLELVNQMLGQASMTPTGQRVMYRSPSIAKYRPTADESTEDPKNQMISVWKDLKKCRYLRLDDDKLDLSGVNTLVRNQMKQFGSLNSNPRTAFTKVALYSPDDTRRRQSVIPGVTSPADSAAALANVLARVASAQSE